MVVWPDLVVLRKVRLLVLMVLLRTFQVDWGVQRRVMGCNESDVWVAVRWDG